MKLKTAALVLALAVSAPCAMADENPYNKVYDATYDYYMPSGPTSMRLSSDGQGHLRTETTNAGRSFVSVTDWNQKITYGIDDTSKAVSKMPMQNAPGSPPPDKTERTSLGEKLVDGHLCEGWQVVTAGHKLESWVDKDAGCTVLMTMDGKPQMRLKTVSKTGIPAQYFTPPPGYRIVDLGEQMRKAQDMAKKYQKGR